MQIHRLTGTANRCNNWTNNLKSTTRYMIFTNIIWCEETFDQYNRVFMKSIAFKTVFLQSLWWYFYRYTKHKILHLFGYVIVPYLYKIYFLAFLYYCTSQYRETGNNGISKRARIGPRIERSPAALSRHLSAHCPLDHRRRLSQKF